MTAVFVALLNFLHEASDDFAFGILGNAKRTQHSRRDVLLDHPCDHVAQHARRQRIQFDAVALKAIGVPVAVALRRPVGSLFASICSSVSATRSTSGGGQSSRSHIWLSRRSMVCGISTPDGS